MGIYLISDTHFDHANIIKYCGRPFESLQEMDETLIENWNRRVGSDDVVLFGGDIAMARGSVALEYVEKLNGGFMMVEGNHDGDISSSVAPFPILKSHIFTYSYAGAGDEDEEEYEFYYTHWPKTSDVPVGGSHDWPKYAEPPSYFDGWVLHGHLHNNDIEEFPFVNPEDKYVNVSVEVLEYTPIEMDELIPILEQGERYETINDVPESLRPF